MLSERLKTLALCVKPYRSVIDVGCDHCYVPIYLVQNELVDAAIGTDVRTGPIEEAKRNIKLNGLENQIEIRMGNGLSAITTEDYPECIIIAGMGGKLIVEILNTANHLIHLNKRLILQANLDEDLVRIWLCENHYEIVKEIICFEDGKFYEIMVAEKSDRFIQLSPLEIKYGPLLLKIKSELFLKKYQQLLEIKKQVYLKIPDYHENKKVIRDEIADIEDILKN